jgi:hypothetical protein
MAKMQKKSLNPRVETHPFDKGKVELANLSDVTIGKATLEPGWSWEKCVKPVVKINSRQPPYTQYIISGRIRVRMDAGEEEVGSGVVGVVPHGYNGRIVGNEPLVSIDFTGMKEYAKKQ